MMPKKIILAQQVPSIVVAVGCADNELSMIFLWFGMLAKSDATLMVKFDNDYRAVHAVIENPVIGVAAHPTKKVSFKRRFTSASFTFAWPSPIRPT